MSTGDGSPCWTRLAWRVRVVDLLAIALSFGWFTFTMTRPDAYNGRLCCDSTQYIFLARRCADLSFVLRDYGNHAVGYPLFLHLHDVLHEALGLPESPDWITLSLFSSFGLVVASLYAFYGALWSRGTRVPRLALWLLLIHPGLASYAATPLTDAFALALLLLSFSCLLRLDWTFRRRNLLLAVAIGFLLAWLVLTRPTHYVPAVVVLAAFCLTGTVLAVRRRTGAVLLLPLATLVVFASITAPRHYACTTQSKGFCFMSPQERDANLRIDLEINRVGVRTYGYVFYDQRLLKAHAVTAPDPFVQKHFGDPPTGGPLVTALLAWYRDRAPFVPLLVGKKIVALFDNLHLGAYAAFITTPAIRWWNRLFGMLGFAGFVGLVVLSVLTAARGAIPLPVLLPLLYLATYLGVSVIPHVEARYGFPFVPPSFVALALLGRETLRGGWRRWAAVALLAGACGLFLMQTAAWDSLDPLLLSQQAGPR